MEKILLKDKLIFGSFIGLVAGLLKDLLTLIFYQLKILDGLFCHFAGGMFFRFSALDLTSPEWPLLVIGYLGDLTLSGILGVIFVYLVKTTGPRYIILKGIFYGAAVWFAIFGGVLALGISKVQEKQPVHTLIMFFVHLLFGYVLGLLLTKYGKPIFDTNP